MYMPCVKCSCSELELAKHLHTVLSSIWIQKIKTIKREYLPLFGFSVAMTLPRKVPDVTKEQIYVYAISR